MSEPVTECAECAECGNHAEIDPQTGELFAFIDEGPFCGYCFKTFREARWGECTCHRNPPCSFCTCGA